MFGIDEIERTTTVNNETKLKLAEDEFEKLYSAPTEIVLLLSIFYGVISIITIIGNTLVIWVVTTTRQMHTVTNMYIANLAFADVIIGMFCIPFQAALLQTWHLPEFMCAFCPFIQVVSVNVSVFTLTAIAVDRHRAIINPLRARPTRFISKMIIFGIWVAAFSFAIPSAIAFRVEILTERYRKDDIIYNITRPFCENVNLTDEQLRTYRYYLVFVQYVVPFCVISFVYIQMAVKLWGSRTPGNAQDARDITLMRNKKKVIKMLIIVVVVFGICWLPLQTYNILYVTWSELNEYQFINIIWFCCDWLAMSNSCYNPFIYGIYNEKFKREFNKRFSVCLCKLTTNANRNSLHDRTNSIHTRASSLRSNSVNMSARNRNSNQLHLNTKSLFLHGTNETDGNNINQNCGDASISSPTSPLVIKNDAYTSNSNSESSCSSGGRDNSGNSKKGKLQKCVFSIKNNDNYGQVSDDSINSILPHPDSNCHQRKVILAVSTMPTTDKQELLMLPNDNKSFQQQQQQQQQQHYYHQIPKLSVNGEEIGDGLRTHKGRIIDTNRNQNNVHDTNTIKKNIFCNIVGNYRSKNSKKLHEIELSETAANANNYPLLIRQNNYEIDKNESDYCKL